MVNSLKQVYKTIYRNTHPFAFVYSQRQKIRSMTAITTKPYAMASPIRSRVPGPRFQQPPISAYHWSLSCTECCCSVFPHCPGQATRCRQRPSRYCTAQRAQYLLLVLQAPFTQPANVLTNRCFKKEFSAPYISTYNCY